MYIVETAAVGGVWLYSGDATGVGERSTTLSETVQRQPRRFVAPASGQRPRGGDGRHSRTVGRAGQRDGARAGRRRRVVPVAGARVARPAHQRHPDGLRRVRPRADCRDAAAAARPALRRRREALLPRVRRADGADGQQERGRQERGRLF